LIAAANKGTAELSTRCAQAGAKKARISMHFSITMQANYREPRPAIGDGGEIVGKRPYYLIVIGVNADDLASALDMARKHIIADAEKDGYPLADITQVESREVDGNSLPPETRANALQDPDCPGVYSRSGKMFYLDRGRRWWQFWK
jgi:hypothetical protein